MHSSRFGHLLVVQPAVVLAVLILFALLFVVPLVALSDHTANGPEAPSMPLLTPTPSLTPTATSTTTATPPTATVTPTSIPTTVFQVEVSVNVPKATIQISETITAVVTVDNQSIGCVYPIYDLTLSQQGDPIFRFESPAVVGPGVGTRTVYTLTAIHAGVTALRATAYGERNCGDFWQWTYVNGTSEVITTTGAARIGDGNGDGAVDGDDFTACIQELFDGDGTDPNAAPGGDFAGTVGCDVNIDETIDAGDVSCLLLRLHQGPGACSLSAASTAPVTLTLGTVQELVNGSGAVTLTLSSGGEAVAAAAFALQFNERFDLTDENQDGLPDGLEILHPDGVWFDTLWIDEQLAVVLYSSAAPPAPFADGMEVTLLLPLDETKKGNVPVAIFSPIASPSLGSTVGTSLVTRVLSPLAARIYMPLITR